MTIILLTVCPFLSLVIATLVGWHLARRTHREDQRAADSVAGLSPEERCARLIHRGVHPHLVHALYADGRAGSLASMDDLERFTDDQVARLNAAHASTCGKPDPSTGHPWV